MLPITLAAEHLVENIKNPAFTGASHFAGIPKSGNAKFRQLHWRQNNLLKYQKSGLHKPSMHRGKSLCQNY
jgi:hypothetical protein